MTVVDTNSYLFFESDFPSSKPIRFASHCFLLASCLVGPRRSTLQEMLSNMGLNDEYKYQYSSESSSFSYSTASEDTGRATMHHPTHSEIARQLNILVQECVDGIVEIFLTGTGKLSKNVEGSLF